MPPPGPEARRYAQLLERYEAPGINTLVSNAAGPLWLEALGANVLDVDGNRYIDLTAGFGVAALGHRHPQVVAAVQEQADRLIHGLADVHAHPGRIDLARRLVELVPVDRPRLYFAISGADAVEIALKTCLLATGKPGIVAFEPSYHGLTLGALQVSSRSHFRAPFESHFHHSVQRLPFACDSSRIETVLAAGGIGALILEPVVGREGVLIPPDGWVAEVASLCSRFGVLLVADEIFTGFGRVGGWFAVERENVRPDVLCCGKALGGGLPIAAVVGREQVFSSWNVAGEALHSATFVAHPLACAASLAALDILEQEHLPERARVLGRELGQKLSALARTFAVVRQARGRGLFWGLELSSAGAAHKLASDMLARGVLVLAGGKNGRVLQLVPPLNITREQLDTCMSLLEGCLKLH